MTRLSGDDSELDTTWDEICVQVQDEESVFWDVYDEIVRDMVRAHVAELPKFEREAIWFQTDAGIDWACDEPEDRNSYPVTDDDIVELFGAQIRVLASCRLVECWHRGLSCPIEPEGLSHEPSASPNAPRRTASSPCSATSWATAISATGPTATATATSRKGCSRRG